MKQDRIRWNARYRTKVYANEPSRIIRAFYALAPQGRALDIACGTGRNALFLADRGFQVDAVDISDVVMERLADRHPRVHPICADLDTFDIPRECYSLVLNIRFLSRRLFPYIREALIPGGILIFETYLERPGDDSYRPSCRDHLLRDNELLHAFLSLRVLFYQETKQDGPEGPSHVASLVAQKQGLT